MTDVERDNILFQVETMGIRVSDVAKNCKTTTLSVYYVRNYFNAAKKDGFSGVIELIKNGGDPGKPLVMWALKRAQITLTKSQDDELNALLEQKRMRFTKTKKTIEEIPVPPNVEVVVKEKPTEETVPDNGVIAFTKLVHQLEIIANQNKVIIETLKSGFDAVADAITALSSDIKDNTNLNSDLVCERLKEQTDILNGIKMNTRKRGL